MRFTSVAVGEGNTAISENSEEQAPCENRVNVANREVLIPNDSFSGP